MPVELEIQEERVKHLNDQAMVELRDSLDRYSTDILKEAGRLEVATRSTTGDPEITSSMINDADLLLRRGYIKPKKPRLLMIAKFVSPMAALLTGLLGNERTMGQPVALIGFFLILSLAITATAIAIMKD